MAVARERWATKIGLGNFLRFPRQAALNGGGAFLVPYVICLRAIGIPLMWIELAIGRMGGRHGRGRIAGMFELMWRHPAAKYIGALGLFIPFAVAMYYVFVESWCLAYAYFSLSGSYFGLGSMDEVGHYLAGFQGI